MLFFVCIMALAIIVINVHMSLVKSNVYCIFFQFKSASEGLSILLQVGWTLAIAEDVCQFEHRDLHWSNILVAQHSQDDMVYTFSSTGDKYKMASSGVKAHIIDFTLSRLNKGLLH